MTYRLITGDCIEALRNGKAESIDAIVCDPPYGIEFMGKTWDSPAKMLGQATGISGGFNRIEPGVHRPDMSKCDGELFGQWCEAWAIEALRVLKPGGHLLAFGGTRMSHWLAVGIERAGFEIRDTIAWMYGSGFPKSHNVANSIDKSLGHGNRGKAIPTASQYQAHDVEEISKLESNPVEAYEARSDAAAPWTGWGTALKPAHEPIIVARKKLAIPGKRAGTMKKANVAQNVLEHGTGAINIDGCRVGTDEMVNAPGYGRWNDYRHDGQYTEQDEGAEPTVSQGRWPANVILDEAAGALLDEQAPKTGAIAKVTGNQTAKTGASGIYHEFGAVEGAFHGDGLAGASRFFYCAKASKSEREAGLSSMPVEEFSAGPERHVDNGIRDGKRPVAKRSNLHPTVKPLALMRYLVRLVTPPGGVVLDPFMGSGTTGIAALLEGFKFIGMELDESYVEIARKRIEHWTREAVNA